MMMMKAVLVISRRSIIGNGIIQNGIIQNGIIQNGIIQNGIWRTYVPSKKGPSPISFAHRAGLRIRKNSSIMDCFEIISGKFM